MAAESNTGFCHEGAFGSAFNRHAISFQSGAVNSTSEMMSMYCGVNNPTGMVFIGNSGVINNHNPRITQAGSSSGSLLVDSVPGLKHETCLAVEWSVEDQYRLEEGFAKYADEPNIMRYVKIAATLRDKTVRDVALRCRWMTRKRRKRYCYMGKKVKDRKDKMAELSSRTNLSSTTPSDMAPFSLMRNGMDHSEYTPLEALSGTTRHLLEQNNQVLNQISANLSTNLSTSKLQENFDLFFRSRNNIAAILNDMREMPGIMSHMTPMTVSMNEDLANDILHSTSQVMMFGSSSGIQLNQEPGCYGESS